MTRPTVVSPPPSDGIDSPHTTLPKVARTRDGLTRYGRRDLGDNGIIVVVKRQRTRLCLKSLSLTVTERR